MSELRPCIVRTGEETEVRSNCLGERKKTVIQEPIEYEGWFHCWHEKQWPVDAIMIGSTGGQMSQIFGIVEYEDGTVHEHYPSEIQFKDRGETS